MHARDVVVEGQVVRHTAQIPPDCELAPVGLLRGERLELDGELCARVVVSELDARATYGIDQQVFELRLRADADVTRKQPEREGRIVPQRVVRGNGETGVDSAHRRPSTAPVHRSSARGRTTTFHTAKRVRRRPVSGRWIQLVVATPAG